MTISKIDVDEMTRIIKGR